MSEERVVARFWRHHCQYNEPFARVSDAWRFLREGQKRHDLAAFGVARVDGSLILGRDDLDALGRLPPAALDKRLADLDRAELGE